MLYAAFSMNRMIERDLLDGLKGLRVADRGRNGVAQADTSNGRALVLGQKWYWAWSSPVVAFDN